MKVQFDIAEIIRIERKNDENTISDKTFDFSYRTIEKLLQNGYEDTMDTINNWGDFKCSPIRECTRIRKKRLLYFLILSKSTPIFESGCMKTIPRDLRPITYNNTSGSATSLNATEIRPSCNLDILKI